MSESSPVISSTIYSDESVSIAADLGFRPSVTNRSSIAHSVTAEMLAILGRDIAALLARKDRLPCFSGRHPQATVDARSSNPRQHNVPRKLHLSLAISSIDLVVI